MSILHMKQNQNGISSRFFKPKLKANFFLLNCHPGVPQRERGRPQRRDEGGLRGLFQRRRRGGRRVRVEAEEGGGGVGRGDLHACQARLGHGLQVRKGDG